MRNCLLNEQIKCKKKGKRLPMECLVCVLRRLNRDITTLMQHVGFTSKVPLGQAAMLYSILTAIDAEYSEFSVWIRKYQPKAEMFKPTSLTEKFTAEAKKHKYVS